MGKKTVRVVFPVQSTHNLELFHKVLNYAGLAKRLFRQAEKVSGDVAAATSLLLPL